MTCAQSLLATIEQAAGSADLEAFRALLWSEPERLREYLHSFELDGAPPNLLIDYANDALARFLRTLELVPLPAARNILEIGSNPYLFHILLHKVFPKSNIKGINFFNKNIFSSDLDTITQTIHSRAFQESYSFDSTLVNIETADALPFDAGEFDLIFFCETLEHLVVNPLSVFSKLRRILNPGGHLVITLPNAVRLTNVALMLEGLNLFDLYSNNGVHGRHNREFTLEEMIYLLASNGFVVNRAETHDRYDYDIIDIWSNDYTGNSVHIPRRKRDIVDALQRAGGVLANRGDNLYLVATPAKM